LTCDCKKKWQEIIDETPAPFEKRVEIAINTLESTINIPLGA
jgi:hypothetical protein